MIAELQIRNFKNFASATLHVGAFTVIVGANASGKSNIRDAFRFIHGIGRGYSISEIIGGRYGAGGQVEWAQLRGAANEIIRIGQNEFSFKVKLSIENGSAKYHIKIKADPETRGGFRVVDESLDCGWRTIFTTSPGPNDPVSRQDDEAHLLVRMEKTGDQKKFGQRLAVRPDQPALTQINEFKQVTRAHKEIIRLVALAFEEIRFLDLIPEFMRKPAFPGQIVLGDSGENLPTVLQEICQDRARGEALAEWIRELTPMDVKELRFPRDQVTGLIQLQFEEANGQLISAYSASDGTLRFLAMLAALLGAKSRGLFFLEEIDNGIHPSRLRLLLDLIESQTKKKQTQVITTTHSPELLTMVSDATFENTSVVYRGDDKYTSDIRPVQNIANAKALRSSQGLGVLQASGWMEDALAFEDDGARG